MDELAERVSARLAESDIEGARRIVAATADPGPRALGEAMLALATGDYDAGVAYGKRALELGAGALGHRYLAMLELSRKQADAAVAHAREAAKLDPSPTNRSSLGGVLATVGRADEATAVLRQLLAEHPELPDAHVNLGVAAVQRADYGEAITHYARALALRPTDPRPLQSLLTMFVEVGKWLGAISAVELSRTGDPPPEVAVTLDLVMTDLIRRVATSFPHAGVTSDADETVDRLIANAARCSVGLQSTVARTLLEVGRVADAQRLVASSPVDNASPRERAALEYVHAVIAEQAGDTLRARELYGRALRGDPEAAEAAVNLVSLLLQDGSPQAFAEIERALAQVSPGRRNAVPELLFNEAVFHARSKRRDAARATFERLLSVTHANRDLALAARRALEDLERGAFESPGSAGARSAVDAARRPEES